MDVQAAFCRDAARRGGAGEGMTTIPCSQTRAPARLLLCFHLKMPFVILLLRARSSRQR